jgi:hypothetical protein
VLKITKIYFFGPPCRKRAFLLLGKYDDFLGLSLRLDLFLGLGLGLCLGLDLGLGLGLSYA